MPVIRAFFRSLIVIAILTRETVVQCGQTGSPGIIGQKNGQINALGGRSQLRRRPRADDGRRRVSSPVS
jgi:hypothetical protein